MDRSWKLSHKISLFTMLISAIVIITTSLVIVTSQNQLAREQATRGIQVLAEVTAYNIAAPTMFQDEEAATTVLSALQLEPMVTSALLLSMDQAQLAQFSRESDAKQDALEQLTIPVQWKGASLGTLVLDLDMTALDEKLYREIGLSVLLGLVAVFSAGLLLQWMSHRLTKPLQALSDVAQSISLNGDYNLRATPVPNRDEVGLLTKNFNQMLVLIEKQDSYLRKQQDTLKASEQRLKLATASAGLGIWDWNIAENTLLWDDRMYEIYGVKRDAESNHIETWLNSVHPDDRDRALKDHDAAMRGKKEFDTVYRVICPDDTLKHIKANAVVLKNREGNAERMLGINADVTEQELNLVKLKEAAELKERLAQVSKMESVGQLAAGIAHDFNNMLGAIMGFSEISRLKASSGDVEAIRHYQDKILEAGGRAKELISQMLAFSRSQPQVEGNDAPVASINSIVIEVISLLRPIIPATIELNCFIPSEELRARIQPLQLQQILLNLGVNAKDASGEYGKIEVVMSKVHLKNSLCNSCNKLFTGDYVEIVVKDNGSGISDSLLANIFTPFFTTKAIGKGTGMGLSVVHGLVHTGGGHIQVVSNQETGTQFKILLPLVNDEIQAPTPDTEYRLEKLDGINMMVIDDEPALTDMLSALFSEYGAHVAVYNEPEKALKALIEQDDKIDIVITDETMPGMSGMLLAEKILKEKPSLPIILCTGYSEHANAESAAEIGIAGFFYKPVNMVDLRLKVQALVKSNAK